MKIQDLLSDPSKWTTKAFARDAHGIIFDVKRVSNNVTRDAVNDPSATCWCLVGAVAKCYDEMPEAILPGTVLQRIANEIAPLASVSGSIIWDWNDHATFADVRALIEKLDI